MISFHDGRCIKIYPRPSFRSRYHRVIFSSRNFIMKRKTIDAFESHSFPSMNLIHGICPLGIFYDSIQEYGSPISIDKVLFHWQTMNDSNLDSLHETPVHEHSLLSTYIGYGTPRLATDTSQPNPLSQALNRE